jgi:hypothetical protein
VRRMNGNGGNPLASFHEPPLYIRTRGSCANPNGPRWPTATQSVNDGHETADSTAERNGPFTPGLGELFKLHRPVCR